MKRMIPQKGEDESLDAFFHGRILLLQKRKGYRFSVDAPLLASFIRSGPGDELCELGAGCGVVSLLLSLRPFRHITAVEVQTGLADLARRNVTLNGLENKVTVVRADFRRWRPRHRFDVVFSNPPYIPGRRGSLSASEEKSIAKHEVKCDILEVMRTASRLLKRDGRAYFIFPEKRRRDFETAASQNGLRLVALRLVHPRRGECANLFLAACDFRPGGGVIHRPFILYDARGAYTREAQRMFAGGPDA